MKIKYRYKWYHAFIYAYMAFSLLLPQLYIFDPIQSIVIAVDQRQWIPIHAQVTKSELKKGRSFCGDLSVQVSYLYLFKNKQYLSSQYSFQDCFPLDYKRKAQIKNSYQIGQEITAYVNPQKPQEAVLLKDPLYNIVAKFAPVFATVTGLLICALTWWWMRPNQAQLKFRYTDYLPENKSQVLYSGKKPFSKMLTVLGFLVLIITLFLWKWAFNPTHIGFYLIWVSATIIFVYYYWETYYLQVFVRLPKKNIFPGDNITIEIFSRGNEPFINELSARMYCEDNISTPRVLFYRLPQYYSRQNYYHSLCKLFAPDIKKVNTVSLQIPEDAEPSLYMGSCMITWYIEIEYRTKHQLAFTQKFKLAIWPKVLDYDET